MLMRADTRAVPMIHVPDVAATAQWYQAIGFTLVRVNEECGEVNWALLALGSTEVMFSAGGQPSSAVRREMDLYIHASDVVAAYALVVPQADLVEDLHDTEYGMREFIVRDPNRFWLTFGQPVAGLEALTG